MIAPILYILPEQQAIPKGVRISYRNLDTFTRNLVDKKLYHLSDPANRYLAFASISFDASILELMMCIPVGGTLILAGEDERRVYFFTRRTDQARVR